MINTNNLVSIIIAAGSFISAFAAIASGIMMASVTKKFGTGILASGFKTNAIGICFIALGILLDAVNSYIQTTGFIIPSFATIALLLVKEASFIVGTYIIVIGSKKTGDKIENITK